ncbi:RHS repeat domain-containing protein [Pseudoalteromonas viridis]|uniref:RHS repeat protein n=1 Tax=Pseudoalteromonas viridis TaxID=339617 RepID=A0ABX7VCR6_9GAMM|nr:RHS repeat domain-containing protein [Pseudoalteromonas viridis]QTL37572.1 RHS repeat protein [Pseudoalteromonas viridis]
MSINKYITIILFVCFNFDSYAVTYKYDNANRITEATYKDGTVVSYTYDKNGNLLSITPTESSSGGDGSDTGSGDTEGAGSTTQVTPEPEKSVDGGKCFIATAAYGSYFDPKVRVLRNFRDEYLLTTSAGKYFVEQYYYYSPPLADYISNREYLKTTVRVVLTPVVFIIETPFQTFTLLLIFTLFSFRSKLRRVIIKMR